MNGRSFTHLPMNATDIKCPGTGLGLVLGCLAFVALLRCEAQNLVPNPGFEESDSCLFGLGSFISPLAPTHWFSTNLTADHLQGCLPYGSANGLPLSYLTFQYPFEGNSCAGIITYHENGPNQDREWITVQLAQPLVPGQEYFCSFRANAAFGGINPVFWLASSKVGMRFTNSAQPWQGVDAFPAPLNFAHVFYPQILADTVGWTLVSGSFMADSAYQYLSIGNFFSNAQTDTLHFAAPGSVFPWYPRGYTLLDAVCVSASPLGCDLAHGVEDGVAAMVSLFPNPTHDVLHVLHAAGTNASVVDLLGRSVWRGVVTTEQWELDVRSWARTGYVLTLERAGRLEKYKFVLIE